MRERLLPMFLGSAAILAAGCGGEDNTSVDGIPSDDPFAMLLQDLTALNTPCVYVASARQLTVTLTANETALIKRVPGPATPADDFITVNGFDCNVVVPAGTTNPVTRVNVVGTTGAETVILDFADGAFAFGSNASSGITVDLGAGSADTLGIRLGGLDDTVTYGSSGVAIVNSAATADAVRDISALNTEFHKILLGAGADTITASGSTVAGVSAFTTAGTLEMSGGEGNDVFLEGSAKTLREVISGGNGTDTLTYSSRTSALTMTITAAGVASANDGDLSSAAGSPPENDDIKDDIEVINAASGNDNISGGGTQGITVFAGAGNDTLAGGLGADTLSGGIGNDRFFEGVGGTTGADVFVGSDGTDVIDYSGRSDGVVVLLDGTANDGETGELDNVGTDIENIIGGDGADSLTGSALNNIIVGGPGADTVHGGAGLDTLSYAPYSAAVTATLATIANGTDSSAVNGTGAGAEADVLFGDIENLTGGAGADELTGNSGPNELVGGAGSDTLTGGAGDDVLEGGSAGNTEGNVLDCGPDGDIGYAQGSGGGASKTACEF